MTRGSWVLFFARLRSLRGRQRWSASRAAVCRTAVVAALSTYCCLEPMMGFAAETGEHPAPRQLTVDDILRMEDFGRSVMLPRGEAFIYEQIPPWEEAPNIGAIADVMDRSPLAKLYFWDLVLGSDPVPLFEQEPRGGYWLGGLSPDGEKLAVYSMVDRGVRAGVFSLRTKQLKWFEFTPNYFRFFQRPVWISNDELIYPTLVAGEKPTVMFRMAVAANLNVLWERAFAGELPSVTVMRSTPDGQSEAGLDRPGELLRVDATSGRSRVLAEGYFYNLLLSPDGTRLAALKEGGLLQVAPDEQPIEQNARRELIVLGLKTGTAVSPCARCNVLGGSIRWSADGERLVFTSSTIGEAADRFHINQLRVTDSMIESQPVPVVLGYGCSNPWAGPVATPVGPQGMIAVYTPNIWRPGLQAAVYEKPDCRTTERRDWWLVGPGKAAKNLTAGLADVSGTLVAARMDSLFVLADDHVWRVNLDGSRQRITRKLARPAAPWSRGRFQPVQRAFLDAAYAGVQLPSDHAVMQTPDEIILLDLKHGKSSALQKPKIDDTLIELSENGASAAYHRGREGIVELVLSTRKDGSTRGRKLNAYLSDLAEPASVTLTYNYKGEQLSSCLMLPLTWRPGRKLAMIVDAYPGSLAKRDCDRAAGFYAYDARLFGSQGYAVLFPANPSRLDRTEDGPLQGIADVILAAVDAAINEGYADPQRIGLFGLSQGHGAALQIIADTTRFRVAVVSHGNSDFLSAYGTLPLYSRMLADYPAYSATGRYEYSRTNGLGAKPWERPDQFARNSPISRADRIQTPVMIMHSDFDGFPLGQSEEIFSALYRLRKEATYVTYWGEGHGNLSPANIRDMWTRMFAWYARFLCDPALRVDGKCPSEPGRD